MAHFILNDAEVVVNAVDLSDHVSSVRLNYSAELQDNSSMGDDTRKRLAGIKEWSIEVEFKQDFAAAEVDATLFTLVGAAFFTVTVMPDKSLGVSATNPKYSGSAVLESYPPLDGAFGDLAKTSVVFQSAGVLSRLTA